MAWECAECRSVESGDIRVNAVCHHCGKLLCREDQLVFADPAFAAGGDSAGAEAVHCRECASEYHPVLGWAAR